MRIGDVIQLKWADISERRIIYQEGKKRHLGSGKLYIPLNAYAMELIERQPQTGAYIFGELRGKTATENAAEIESREATMNSTLFKIAIRAGINKCIHQQGSARYSGCCEANKEIEIAGGLII